MGSLGWGWGDTHTSISRPVMHCGASCSCTFPSKALSPQIHQISSLLSYKLQRGCLNTSLPVLGDEMSPFLWNVGILLPSVFICGASAEIVRPQKKP